MVHVPSSTAGGWHGSFVLHGAFIELELRVKQPGRDTPVEMRCRRAPRCSARRGAGASQPGPVFATRRCTPIDRDALGTRAEAYFQPSFDADADSGEPKRPNLPTHPNNPYNGPTPHDDEGFHDA